jgi:hypothetical protein
MFADVPTAVLIAALSIGLVLVLVIALVLLAVSVRRPSNIPLVVSASLVVAAVMVVAIAPLDVPLPVGLLIALLGTALAIVGGNPLTRRVLDMATHGEVREGVRGGILVYDSRSSDTDRMQ